MGFLDPVEDSVSGNSRLICGLPAVGQELIELAYRRGRDACKHVAEVGEGFDLVPLRSLYLSAAAHQMPLRRSRQTLPSSLLHPQYRSGHPPIDERNEKIENQDRPVALPIEQP